jgi:hypothetical protein
MKDVCHADMVDEALQRVRLPRDPSARSARNVRSSRRASSAPTLSRFVPLAVSRFRCRSVARVVRQKTHRFARALEK